ncbi:MAG: ADP-heptose:LPS heptosyltransferase [Crocinitomicaceae bacterium]|jgi:ADP-heptose:LPS heptosyltransferase
MCACLVIKNDGIGDLVVSSGLIALIADQFDGVDLIVPEPSRFVAERIPGVRRVLSVSRSGIRPYRIFNRVGLTILRRPAPDLRVVDWLKRHDYDVAVCLRRYIRYNSLMLMPQVRAARKYCCWQFPTDCNNEFALKQSMGWSHYNPKHEPFSELLYFEEFLRATLDLTGNTSPRLSLNPLPVGRVNSKPVIALIMGGASAAWSIESWKQLAEKCAQSGYRVSLFGGKDVFSQAEAIARGIPGCKNNVGTQSLIESEALLSCAELVISNDTGLGHLASLRSKKVLIIMGGGTFPRFFPWPQNANQYLILKPMSCYGCDWRCEYSERLCLTAITADAVFSYAETILDGGGQVSRFRVLGTYEGSFNALKAFPFLGRYDVDFSQLVRS